MGRLSSVMGVGVDVITRVLIRERQERGRRSEK